MTNLQQPFDRLVENCVITSGADKYPFQVFNGKEYHLYNGERYYSRGCTRLHVVVYEYYFGKVSDGFHVHHSDENTFNNHPSNLEQLKGFDHISYHMSKVDKVQLVERITYARTFASIWHGSEAGKEWHRQHAKNFNFGNFEYGETSCKQCNKTFTAKASANWFCSNNCKSKWRRNAGIDDVQRACKICGNEFQANKYSKVLTCSGKCASNLKWNRRKLS